jgi:hypothetical protein
LDDCSDKITDEIADIRFGSKADRPGDVCSTPKSGDWLSALGRPLSADFVAEVGMTGARPLAHRS